ncbi:hypothetical protein OAA15_00590 [bacterium]|nr:hypothetical protein [bacterium]
MSHLEQNQRIADIQEIIEDIMGVPTGIKRKESNKVDFKKINFCKTIDNIEHLIQRAFFMNQDFGVNMSKYDEMFFDTMDMLLEMNYSMNELELINFYLYGKYNPDGSDNQFVDDNTNEVILLDTSEDLFFALEDLNPKD